MFIRTALPVYNIAGLATRPGDILYISNAGRLEQTKARKPGEPNPWVVGRPEVRKYLAVVQECAKSWLAIDEGRP